MKKDDPYLTRPTLLHRVNQGDEVSWVDFYEKYSPLIHWLCQRKGLSSEQDRRLVVQAGLMKLMELPKHPVSVPAWVPANVESYSHIGFDMTAFYANLKQTVLRLPIGPMIAPQFEQSEAAFKQQTGVALSEFFASFGTKIDIVTYPMVLKKVEGMNLPVNRQAMVVELKNESIMPKLFATIAAQTGNNKEIKQVEEQGFKGFRFILPTGDMTIFYGKGHFIFTQGPDVAEQVLSAISNNPQGAEAFRNNSAFKKYLNENNPGPSMLFSFGNSDKQMQTAIQALKTLFTTMPSSL